MSKVVLFLSMVVLVCLVQAGELPPEAPNSWTKLEKAVIEGRCWDVPLAYSPDLKRFLVLGGLYGDDAPKPGAYDQLALDLTEGQWENWFPHGKDWGPKFGLCQAPRWKDSSWHLQDSEGNVRPNWSVSFCCGDSARCNDGKG